MSSSNCRNIVLIVCLAGTSVAYGQRFSYGVKGGVSTIEPNPDYNDESKRYIVGATIEFQLWRGFAVEGDFLYRRNGIRSNVIYIPGLLTGDFSPVSVAQRVRLDVFEMPVLGKYYFRRDSKVQPFVLTGYSFRKALSNNDARVTTQTSTGSSTQTFKSSNWTPLDIGAAFGTGVRWRVGAISLMPEIRYTRWGSHPGVGNSKNQADVLLGITF
jgi:Outer membrane protein beta-barrel domain